MATYVKETFADVTWKCDRRIEGGCSRRRPDLFLDMGSHIAIVEVDENKHDTYNRTCENRRMMEISQDLNHRHIVMIRFNPDRYIDPEKGKIPAPWTYTPKLGVSTIKTKWKAAWNDRLEVLEEKVHYWMNNKPYKMIEVIELYY